MDFITQANCMTLNVEAGTIDLSRPELSASIQRQLTKLDLASYKECVAVKEFALNRRPAKRIALRMGG